MAEELIAIGMNAHGGAGRHLRKGCRGIVDLVAEHPGVPGANAAIFAALELENRYV
jgi:hypothetical protein